MCVCVCVCVLHMCVCVCVYLCVHVCICLKYVSVCTQEHSQVLPYAEIKKKGGGGGGVGGRVEGGWLEAPQIMYVICLLLCFECFFFFGGGGGGGGGQGSCFCSVLILSLNLFVMHFAPKTKQNKKLNRIHYESNWSSSTAKQLKIHDKVQAQKQDNSTNLGTQKCWTL